MPALAKQMQFARWHAGLNAALFMRADCCAKRLMSANAQWQTVTVPPLKLAAMNTTDYIATARPFRDARASHVADLQRVRDDIARCKNEASAVPPDDGPSALDIERAKLLDGLHGTANAAPLIEADRAVHAARAEVRRAAVQAVAALPALQARSELLEGLVDETRRLELAALSEAAAQAWPSARDDYRKAAEAMIDSLARLLATTAILGASHRHRLQSEIGQDDLTPFAMPQPVVTLPSLEAIGHDMSEYVSGTTEHIHVAAALQQRAVSYLQSMIG